MDDNIVVPGLDRFRHIYIPGQTQYGKSTLMANQIYDDIECGRGVCVMDAKGDLIRQVLDAFPAHRKDDAIYFDRDHPLPIDILRYKTYFERDALMAELTQSLLRKVDPDDAIGISTDIEDTLRVIFSYNENQTNPSKRATLLDIHYFLQNEERRAELLSGVTNPDIKERWVNPKDFPDLQARRRVKRRTNPYVFSDFLRSTFDVPNPPVNMEW